jgi:hypothetical protein
MQKLYNFLILIFVVLLMGCATHSPGNVMDAPGFFYGLFHGFIIMFSFIASLFTDYAIYSFPNSGGWYNFGFLLGAMSFFGGGGSQAGRRR